MTFYFTFYSIFNYHWMQILLRKKLMIKYKFNQFLNNTSAFYYSKTHRCMYKFLKEWFLFQCFLALLLSIVYYWFLIYSVSLAYLISRTRIINRICITRSSLIHMRSVKFASAKFVKFRTIWVAVLLDGIWCKIQPTGMYV